MSGWHTRQRPDAAIAWMLQRLQQFELLPKLDQDALLRTVDAFLSKIPTA